MRKHYLIILCLLAGMPVFSNEGDPVGNQITKLFLTSDAGARKWGLIHYPASFFNSNATYPLLVFNHGIGEGGTTEATLPKLNTWGPGWFMANQNWDMTVANPLTGRPYEFLYFAMQDGAWSPSVDEVMYVINNDPLLKDRIDKNAIFITGISAGGGSTINFTLNSRESATRVAAIVPMSAAPSFTWDNISIAQESHVPIWAFHGLNDKVCDYRVTTMPYIDYINTVSPYLTKWTQLPAAHTGWNAYYAPTYRELISGVPMNIYEWMLYHMKNQEIVLDAAINFLSAKVSESSTTLDWQTVSETNSQKFVIERSEDGTNFSPVAEIPTKATNGNSTQPLNYQFIYQHK